MTGSAGRSPSRNIYAEEVRKQSPARNIYAEPKREYSPMSREGMRQTVQMGMEAASELKDSAEKARKDVFRFAQHMVRLAIGMVGWNVNTIRKKGVVAWASEAYRLAPIKARQAATEADQLFRDRCFQATAASSVTGAVTLGTAGGVAGLATGATIGGVVGMPLALFTFGLSIPVSATIGGTCGLVTGAAAGGTVGAVCGGATGYKLYQRRDQIAAMWKSGRQELTRMTKQARQYARERISAVRRKFAGGSA